MDDRIEFLKTAADTEGKLLEVRAAYAPHSPRPPAHYHPYQEESFEVMQGTIRASIDGREAIYRAGETFSILPGVRHWMENPGNEYAVVLWRTRPALRTEVFLSSMWNLDLDEPEGNSRTSLLRLAVILAEFRSEFRLASPPEPLQRAVIGLLALLGRARGYRPPSIEAR